MVVEDVKEAEVTLDDAPKPEELTVKGNNAHLSILYLLTLTCTLTTTTTTKTIDNNLSLVRS